MHSSVSCLFLQDERLLRELLPPSGTSPDVVNTFRGSQNQEDWLVGSEFKSADHDTIHEVTDVQQRLQLHEVLADQLQGQLQQQQEVKERLEQSVREQQGVATTLQIQLEQSRNEAEELQSQLALSHGREEEARQRGQLQDVLGEQLLSQLQDVTRQRDEHERTAHELRSALADLSKQVGTNRVCNRQHALRQALQQEQT
jgi:chromosome segregation ATPase